MIEVVKFDGNIANVSHTADLENGVIVGLGAVDTDFDGNEVLSAVQPATADLGSKEYLLVVGEENVYRADETAADYVNEAGVPFKALHLQKGDKFRIAKSVITGTPVAGQYLVPADGQFELAAAADLTGGTQLAFEVELASTTLGDFDKTPAVKVRVISA